MMPKKNRKASKSKPLVHWLLIPTAIAVYAVMFGGTSAQGDTRQQSIESVSAEAEEERERFARQLLEDMTEPHESYAHGIDLDWEWGTDPRLNVGVNFPLYYDDPHFTPWGIAATSIDGSPARNVRVQIRKMILDVKQDGQWSRVVYNTHSSQLMGSLYTNYETNTHAPANVRRHGTSGISVKLPDSGGSFHFMTTNRFPIAHDAQEIVSRVEARLIVDNANLPDDRASARLLVNSGGDIWRNATANWNPGAMSNVDFAIGRFKYVTNEWQSFSSHTLTTRSEIDDYLENEAALTPR